MLNFKNHLCVIDLSINIRPSSRETSALELTIETVRIQKVEDLSLNKKMLLGHSFAKSATLIRFVSEMRDFEFAPFKYYRLTAFRTSIICVLIRDPDRGNQCVIQITA